MFDFEMPGFCEAHIFIYVFGYVELYSLPDSKFCGVPSRVFDELGHAAGGKLNSGKFFYCLIGLFDNESDHRKASTNTGQRNTENPILACVKHFLKPRSHCHGRSDSVDHFVD
jgi:hypothetical protein